MQIGSTARNTCRLSTLDQEAKHACDGRKAPAICERLFAINRDTQHPFPLWHIRTRPLFWRIQSLLVYMYQPVLRKVNRTTSTRKMCPWESTGGRGGFRPGVQYGARFFIFIYFSGFSRISWMFRFFFLCRAYVGTTRDPHLASTNVCLDYDDHGCDEDIRCARLW